MDLTKFELVSVKSVSKVSSPIDETLYDITTDGDHSFFIHLPESNMDILVHNCDGIHICSLYLGWWLKLAPGLFNQRRICRLITPLAVLYADKSKKKILNYFYTLDEYKAFESAKPDVVKKGVVCYYKGLGSWSKDEFQRLFASSKNGIEDFLEPITLDDVKKDTEILDDWLSDEKSDKRKEYLRKYTLDINQV